MDFASKFNSGFKINPVKVNNNYSMSADKIEQSYDDIDYSDNNVSNTETKEKTKKEPLLEGFLNADSWYVFDSEWTDIIDSSGLPTAVLFGASLLEGLYNAVLMTSAYVADGKVYNISSFMNHSKDIFSSGFRGSVKSFVALATGTDGFIQAAEWTTSTVYSKVSSLLSTMENKIVSTKYYKNISDDALVKLMKQAGQPYVDSLAMNATKTFSIVDDVLEKGFASYQPTFKLGKNGKLVTRMAYSGYNTLGNVLPEFGAFLGIDYLGSLAANFVIGAYQTGKLDLSVDTMKYGSEFLKSSTKMICATAGGLIGGKTGKVVGMVVGTIIGDVQVTAFDSKEGWCAAAGAMQVGGALIGAGIFVFCASNPVGWAVGLALIAGAAIGYGLTYITYQVVEHWDEWVVQPFQDLCEVVTEFASILTDYAVESTGVIFNTVFELRNNRLELSEDVLDEVVDFRENVNDISIDYVDNIGNSFSSLSNNIQDSLESYQNTEYSTFGEQLAGFALMCGDVAVETAESCTYILEETGEFVLDLGEEVYDTACDIVSDGVEYLGDQISTIADGVSDWWDSTTDFIGDLFGGWW